ncbi:MAG: DnaA/Hda family protein, partial [Chlamydiota bacterium]|nr:DnaA/Hda family protein [Chlamydiota bacterium]
MTNDNAISDLNPIWSELQNKAKTSFSAQTYDAWFSPLKAVSLNNGSIVIEAPNKFFKEWILHHYREFIEKTLKDLSGKSVHLDIHIRTESHSTEVQEQPKKKIHLKRKMPVNLENTLNANYTFDSFVVGPSNRFAHAAATAVALSPAKAYNPLFIYGGVGLGKTHLMHAIGQQIRMNQPHLKVYYISSEE